MDLLLIGIVIGVALTGVSYFVIRAMLKSRRISEQNAETKQEMYHELSEKLGQAVSKKEFLDLKEEIESQAKQLDIEAYNNLMTTVEYMIQEILQKEEERAETLSKLKVFRELKLYMDADSLFTELHRIYLGVDGIITYNLLDEYGEKSDIDWFEKTYDTLVVMRMRELLSSACTGAFADYQKVLLLWNELEDFQSSGGKDRAEFIAKHLPNQWNEVVVRFVPESRWYDHVLGLDELNDEDYREIIAKAYNEGDSLSTSLVLWFAKDDEDFQKILLETFLQKLRAAQESNESIVPSNY